MDLLEDLLRISTMAIATRCNTLQHAATLCNTWTYLKIHSVGTMAIESRGFPNTRTEDLKL